MHTYEAWYIRTPLPRVERLAVHLCCERRKDMKHGHVLQFTQLNLHTYAVSELKMHMKHGAYVLPCLGLKGRTYVVSELKMHMKHGSTYFLTSG